MRRDSVPLRCTDFIFLGVTGIGRCWAAQEKCYRYFDIIFKTADFGDVAFRVNRLYLRLICASIRAICGTSSVDSFR